MERNSHEYDTMKPKIHKDLIEYWKELARHYNYYKFIIVDADDGTIFPYDIVLLKKDDVILPEYMIYDTIYVGEA